MPETHDDQKDKKIDESWKNSVKKEKTDLPEPDPESPPEASFSLFVTSLMMQAMIALGEIENPVTKKKEMRGPQAKFIIDTLEMLQKKTKNNLTKDESDLLDSILYELRMHFVGKSTQGKQK